MKIVVFGSTGKTGKHVVQQALDAGHEVRAFARTPSKMDIQHPNLTLCQGDVLDANSVNQAVAGMDAVISALAPSENKPDYKIHRGTQNILKAMQQHNVKRIVASAGAGVRIPEDTPTFLDKFVSFLLNTVSKHVVEDMRRVAEEIQNSNREWVIVRAPMLTDQPGTGDITATYVGQGMKPRLTREDFATFMLQQMQDDTWLHKLPAISN